VSDTGEAVTGEAGVAVMVIARVTMAAVVKIIPTAARMLMTAGNSTTAQEMKRTVLDVPVNSRWYDIYFGNNTVERIPL